MNQTTADLHYALSAAPPPWGPALQRWVAAQDAALRELRARLAALEGGGCA